VPPGGLRYFSAEKSTQTELEQPMAQKQGNLKNAIRNAAAMLVGGGLALRYRDKRMRARALPRKVAENLVLMPNREDNSEVPLEKGINFRDIGGYVTKDGRRVKRKRIYRCGALGDLTDNDVKTLEALNVRRVFDLRLDEEAEKNRDRLPENAQYFRFPVTAGSSSVGRIVALLKNIDQVDEFVVEGYTRNLVDAEAHTFAGILRQIAAADDDGASVIHCTAGKDRTGVAVAVLLSFLGVDDETIAADYSLSNRAYPIFYQQMVDAMHPFRRIGILADDLTDLLMADPEFIRRTLKYLHEQYGDAENYLRTKGGLDQSVLDKLKDMLLE
jgi:protein-tyrosine phosphatase